MKLTKLKTNLGFIMSALILLLFAGCSDDDSNTPATTTGTTTTSTITVNSTLLSFPDAIVNTTTEVKELIVKGVNLNSQIDLTSTNGFEMSLDGVNF